MRELPVNSGLGLLVLAAAVSMATTAPAAEEAAIVTSGDLGPAQVGCTPTMTALQFDGGYEVSMCYVTPDGEVGQAKSGIWASGKAGLLWFFDRGNAEVLVKVLDGCSHNGHRWVFVAPVTTLEFNLSVTAPNGRQWTHSNAQGQTASAKSDVAAFRCSGESTASLGSPTERDALGDQRMADEGVAEDTQAAVRRAGGIVEPLMPVEFPFGVPTTLLRGASTSVEGDPPSVRSAIDPACKPTMTALQFDGGYEVSMCYVTPDGEVGQAESGIWASSKAGLLWFFDRGNAEVLVKVLDGCSHNGHRWVFVAPVTTLEFNLSVTAPNGRQWTHSNAQGQTASAKSDVAAFHCADEEAPPSWVEETPPTWVFAGQVPEVEQNKLREEMEYTRAYFNDEFGVAATGFTVLVGENYTKLGPVYRDVVGVELANHYHPEAKFSYAWVTSSTHGGAVMTLMYGLEDWSFSALQHHIAHEYFHVLQGQVASGFVQLQNGEIGWHTASRSVAPRWLVEGLASYADYKYTPTRLGRRPFMGDAARYSPFEDLGWSQVNGQLEYDDLARSVSYADAVCSFSDVYFYSLSFAAAFFLGDQAAEDSYFEFWKLLGERSAWQQAFLEAFGIEVKDFYRAFEAWLPSQIPSYDQVTIQMHWPNMEVNPQVRGEFLYLLLDASSWENDQSVRWTTGSKGFWQDDLYLTITYPAGAIGKATVSLWWRYCRKLWIGDSIRQRS